MLDILQSTIVVVVTMAAAVVFMLLLEKRWPAEQRRAHNELIGWQLSVLGTTYAVIMGFMLYTVWTNFGAADLNVDFEANALVNVYRLAEGLPAAQGVQIQQLARAYAGVVIDRDWPQMADGRIPGESQDINANMWRTLMSVKAASATEITAEDHALSELSSLSEHRRTRLLQSASRLPAILWSVLVIGAVVTVTSASMFGSANIGLHMFQVLAFSLLVSLVLIAIAEIDRPFQGTVHVTNYAFQRAQQNMEPPS